MDAKHTPGPWATLNFGGNCIAITGTVPVTGNPSAEYRLHCSRMASVTQREPHPAHNGGISHETCAANARLIAAAPELLKELRLLNLDADGEQKRNTPAWRAIAAATGVSE